MTEKKGSLNQGVLEAVWSRAVENVEDYAKGERKGGATDQSRKGSGTQMKAVCWRRGGLSHRITEW